MNNVLHTLTRAISLFIEQSLSYAIRNCLSKIFINEKSAYENARKMNEYYFVYIEYTFICKETLKY